MKDDRTTWIPRNLNDDDVFKMGFGIKFKIGDLPFLVIGGYIGYLIGKSQLIVANFPGQQGNIVRGVIVVISFALSYLFVRSKIHGYELPTLFGNRIIYTSRKGIYHSRRRSGRR